MITTNERQETLIDQHAQLINPAQAKEMREAGLGLIEDRREGAYVWDQAGTRYIDCRQGTSIFNVGRRNPTLIAALKDAVDEYDIGSPLFFSEPRIRLAQKLGRISPNSELKAVTYGVDRRQMNDFAIQLARAQTKRSKVIAMTDGYLSSPLDASVIYHNEVEFAEFGSVDSLRSLINRDTACVILEPVQEAACVRLPPRNYLREVRRLCDAFGALMIIDENETGFGRCGKMFGLDAVSSRGKTIVPDIVTVGNSLGGGLYPITAAIYRVEYLRFWHQVPAHSMSSFAGSDLACIVGLDTIHYIEHEHLCAHAAKMGEKLLRGLRDLSHRYARVLREVRGIGLMIAADFASAEMGAQMSRDLSQFGVLASCSRQAPMTMYITPPLVISKDDVFLILDAFHRAVASNHSLVRPLKSETLESLMHL